MNKRKEQIEEILKADRQTQNSKGKLDNQDELEELNEELEDLN